ncbi:MAG: DUF255 domain-containing protein [Saprospiraceae bacterium]
MKSMIYAVLLSVAVMACSNDSAAQGSATTANTIEWLSWEEAMQRMEKEPRKLFVDVYTDWCGWCKKMDASTFTDPEVVKVMNTHFYAVKFNAEQTADVLYDSHTFKYIADAGRRGVHELAYALLDGRMSYPSFVYLNAAKERISISPGYKEGDAMEVELRYIGEDHFQTTTFEAFKLQQGK